MDFLRSGGRLRVAIGGWYYKNRLVRLATEDVLRRTGEIVFITIPGKRMNREYAVHCSRHLIT